MQEEKQGSKQSDNSKPLLDHQLEDQTLKVDQSSQGIQQQKQKQMQLQQCDNRHGQVSRSNLGGFQCLQDPLSQYRDFDKKQSDGLKQNKALEMDIDETFMEMAENQVRPHDFVNWGSLQNEDYESQCQSRFEDEIYPDYQNPLYRENRDIRQQDIESEAQQSQKQSDKLKPFTEDALKEFTLNFNTDKESVEQLEQRLLQMWCLEDLKAQNTKQRLGTSPPIQRQQSQNNHSQTFEKISAEQENQQRQFTDVNLTNFEGNTVKLQSVGKNVPKLGLTKPLPNDNLQLRKRPRQTQENIRPYIKRQRRDEVFSPSESKSSALAQRNLVIKQTVHEPKLLNQDIESQSEVVFDSSQWQPKEDSEMQPLKNSTEKLHVKQQQPSSKFNLSKQQYRIFKEGFQINIGELFRNLFTAFIGTLRFLLKPYLGSKETKRILGSKYHGKKIDKEIVLELMGKPELQAFWKIVFRQNAIQRVSLITSKSSLRIEYSKLTYLFQYMFENKRFDGFYAEKQKLMGAAQELKAMRNSGLLPNKDFEKTKLQKYGFSKQENKSIIQALERNYYNIDKLLGRFKRILLGIVKENSVHLTASSRKRIGQIENMLGLSVMNCNFLICHWQFTRIWPSAFQQDRINSMFLQSIQQQNPVRFSPNRIKEYSILTMLFQKAYLEGQLTDIYADKNLLLRLAAVINDQTKDQYFEKKPKSYWEGFDSEQFQIKRQEQQRQGRGKVTEKKQQKIQSRNVHRKTIEASQDPLLVQPAAKDFIDLFKQLKSRMKQKLVQQNPNQGYEDIFKSGSFQRNFGRVYGRAFSALFKQALTKQQIDKDPDLKKVIRNCDKSPKHYYFLLSYPLIQEKLSTVFQDGTFSSYIHPQKSVENIQVYKKFSDLFKLAWLKFIRPSDL